MARTRLLLAALTVCAACTQTGAQPPATAPATTPASTSISTVSTVVPSTAAAATTTTSAPLRSFSVVGVGDWLSEGFVNKSATAAAPPGVRFANDPLIAPVIPLIQRADLAICHMETPIGRPGAVAGGAGRGVYGSALISAPYEVAGDLQRAGFDRCSTASNHAWDGGADGVRSTLDALDAAGIGHAGTARTEAEATPTVFVVKGVHVAHLSYTRSSNTGWPGRRWDLERADGAQMAADIAAARADGAEVVIISLHVYWELEKHPTDGDRALVEQLTATAHPDLILITGPHVVQPVERVNGTLVYWSLGNFVSAMGVPDRAKYADPRTLDELLADVQFTERPDGSWATDATTVLLCNTPDAHVVYPGVSTLADPTISPTLRARLTACLTRSSAVVADLH